MFPFLNSFGVFGLYFSSIFVKLQFLGIVSKTITTWPPLADWKK